MKKVLMIGLTRNTGGIETYIINVMRQLSKEYHFFIPYVDNIVYEQEILALGGTFIKDLPHSRRNRLHYFETWKQIFRTYQFDAVYLNDCDLVNLDILKVARRQKVPVRIFHAHSSSHTWELGVAHRLEERLNRKNIDKLATDFFACSKNAGDFMFNGAPYTEIKNGIDTSRYVFNKQIRKNKRKELGLSENQIVILFVGRFTKVKNPLFAVNVMKACHEKNAEFVGLLCGGGELTGEAQTLIDAEKMNASVKLLGSRADINEIYSAADYLVMPSISEGFPFVLVEAQCSGLKCICSTNVEENTNLIGTIEYYSLESGADEWAKRILVMQPETASRGKYREEIVRQGYDIVKTTQEIREILG